MKIIYFPIYYTIPSTHLNPLSLSLSPSLSLCVSPPEQQQNVSALEDKLRALRQSRDESQSHCTQQKQSIAELQARNSQQSLEMDGLRRRIDELQQVTHTHTYIHTLLLRKMSQLAVCSQ